MKTNETVLTNFADLQFTANWIANSISNRQQVCDFCWTIDNVLPPNILNRINYFLDSNDKWIDERILAAKQQGATSYSVNGMPKGPRRSVHWDQPDTSPYRQMHFVFQQLAPVIRGMFENQHTEFQGSTMWEDSPEYTIVPHVDNDSISYAIQIYLNDADLDCGTCMYNAFSFNNIDTFDGEVIYQVPFKKNVGYILKNSANSWHGMTKPGNTRRSVYASYT